MIRPDAYLTGGNAGSQSENDPLQPELPVTSLAAWRARYGVASRDGDRPKHLRLSNAAFGRKYGD
jgi:hypothetical protein